MISASQTDKARECLRKLFLDWEVPYDQRAPQSEAAALGGDVHKVGEDYHNLGTMPDESTPAGRVFMPALAHIPHPRVGRAEGKFHMTLFGVEYEGLIDLSCMTGDLPGTAHLDPAMPAIVDYKTGKDPGKSLLEGPGEFMDDPQALLYAMKRLAQTGADQVYLRWLGLKTEGRPKAYPSNCVMPRKETAEAFVRVVHPVAEALVFLKAKKKANGGLDPLTLPPNPARCLKYGAKYPCPWIERCALTPREMLGTDEVYMGPNMLANLQAQFGQGQAAPAATPAPAAQAAPAPFGGGAPAPFGATGINPKPLAAPAPAAAAAPAPMASPAPFGGAVQASQALPAPAVASPAPVAQPAQQPGGMSVDTLAKRAGADVTPEEIRQAVAVFRRLLGL